MVSSQCKYVLLLQQKKVNAKTWSKYLKVRGFARCNSLCFSAWKISLIDSKLERVWNESFVNYLTFFPIVSWHHLLVVAIIIISLLFFADASSSSSCELSRDWMGRWFHLGFPEPLVISRDEISIKGRCVQRSKNMFLMEER